MQMPRALAWDEPKPILWLVSMLGVIRILDDNENAPNEVFQVANGLNVHADRNDGAVKTCDVKRLREDALSIEVAVFATVSATTEGRALDKVLSFLNGGLHTTFGNRNATIQPCPIKP